MRFFKFVSVILVCAVFGGCVFGFKVQLGQTGKPVWSGEIVESGFVVGAAVGAVVGLMYVLYAIITKKEP